LSNDPLTDWEVRRRLRAEVVRGAGSGTSVFLRALDDSGNLSDAEVESQFQLEKALNRRVTVVGHVPWLGFDLSSLSSQWSEGLAKHLGTPSARLPQALEPLLSHGWESRWAIGSPVLNAETPPPWLEALFTVHQPVDVCQMLHANHFLVDLLRETSLELDKPFPGTERTLALSVDPENEGDARLLVSILVDMAPFEAGERLEQFDEEWWLDNMHRARGLVCINLSFQ
jgi:hypothetical protein